ncbi:unnamed protein product, partial [Meganyctiphanes norvegica]
MSHLFDYVKTRHRRIPSVSSCETDSSTIAGDIPIDDDTMNIPLGSLPLPGTSNEYELPSPKRSQGQKDQQENKDDTSGNTRGGKPGLLKTIANISLLIPKLQSDQLGSPVFSTLSSYITDNDLNGLRSFLNDSSDKVDERDDNGSTALIFAAAQGKVHLCRELLLRG